MKHKYSGRHGLPYFLFLAMFILVAACGSPPTGSSITNLSTVGNEAATADMSFYPWTASREERLKFIQEIINKKTPYTGPITVQIIPGLQKQGLPTFSASLAGSDQTYSIQSVPAGPVVFREVFTKGRQELEQTRSFRVQDTGKRYSLIVQKTGDPTHDGQVNVNINGTAWIKEQDFHGLSQEVQKETLLLQANNSLRVRLKGREGVSVTVTVVEGGESGTILMRRGRLGLPGETQATHVRRNDINIFDPFDSDSLGGLKAFEGDRVDDDGNSIGSLSFNQEEKIEYQSGRILLEFQDAQTSLPEFHRLYGAEVLHQQGQRYLLKLDLSKAPLQDLTSLLSQYNSSIPGNIENVAFGSLASLQTFALFLDIAVHQHDIINAVELNGMMYPQQAVPTCPTSPVPQDWEFSDINLGKSWWLVDTHVAAPLWNPAAISASHPEPYNSGAWDYSIGTGVTVAVIDKGFNTNHKEINRRIKVDPFLGNNVGINNDNEHGDSIDHGHLMVMSGFAEKDNGIGTSGSAPNTDVIPYSGRSYSFADFEDATRLASHHADIISMSFHAKDERNFFFGIFKTSWGEGEMVQITNAVTAGKTVIVSAGNDAPGDGDYRHWIPSNHPLAITVGAVAPIIPGSSDTRTQPRKPSINPCSKIPDPADPNNPNPEKLVVAGYSNYGAKGTMVWAPGEYVKVQERGSETSGNSHLVDARGTSGATPFVAGVVALMKSRNPALTPAEIKDILLTKSLGVPAIATTQMKTLRIPDPSLIDAEAAVKAAGGTKKAETFYGYVVSDNTFGPKRKLRLNAFAQASASATLREKAIPEQTVSDEAFTRMTIGKFVKVRGWSNVQTGFFHIAENQIEISEVEEICNGQVVNSCNNIPEALKNKITKISFDPTPAVSASGFTMTFEGSNLIANLQDGSENSRFTVYYRPYDPATGTYSDVEKPLDIPATGILDIANNGTMVKVNIPAGAIPANKTLEKYEFALSGAGKSDPVKKNSDGTDFGIKSDGSGGSVRGYQVLSSEAPVLQGVTIPVKWIVRDTRKLPVNPESYIGIGLDARRLGVTEVNIDGKPMKLVDVAEKYLSGTLPNDLTPGVKDVIIKLAGGGDITLEGAMEVFARPVLTPMQSLPTQGVDDLNGFTIGDRHYLAISNLYNNSSYNLNLDILRWNGATFDPFQNIPTHGAQDSEFFSIGTDAYLAVANYYDGSSVDIDSKIYKWNGDQFAEYQSLPTHGAAHFTAFNIDGQAWLAVANTFPTGGQVAILYKWNGDQFLEAQQIPTRLARDWEHVQIGKDHYLALANFSGSEFTDQGGGSSFNQDSLIYKWDGTQFAPFQSIATQGAYDWESFTIGDQVYLVVANANDGSGSTANLKSRIYHWDGSQFALAQEIPSLHARGWKHFEVDGEHYLIVANDADSSSLYHWNGTEFVVRQTVDTLGGARSWEFMQVGNQTYLVMQAHYNDNGGFNGLSTVFSFH